MYALTLGTVLSSDNGRRILSACDETYQPSNPNKVDNLPSGDISDWLYVNGDYVKSELPAPTPSADPIDLEKVEAQTTYTALMTDTLIEEGEDEQDV